MINTYIGGFCRVVSRCLFVFGSVATLAGCAGVLSGAGPYSWSITSEAESETPRYKMIDLSAATIGPYMRPAPTPPVSSVGKESPYEVSLVPGDVIKVVIADSAAEGAIFAPLASGGTVFELRVDSHGKINLPYLGDLRVAGDTTGEVREKILKGLRGTGTDLQAMVSIVGDVSGSVLVAGAVKQPGRFSALQGPLTLLDAINMAGGPTLDPHLVNVVVRDGTTVQTLSYENILNGQNYAVAPRSEIIVERSRQRFVAMGAIRDPGLHDLPSQYPSLLETLGVAGWLNEGSANPQGVFIFRLSSDDGDEPTAEVFRLNMRDPAAVFLARQFLVHPEDAVYVTNAAVYEWQKIISPIVQVLILGRTVNGGF